MVDTDPPLRGTEGHNLDRSVPSGNKPIDITSSVGPGTSEVVSMKKQVEESGRPVSAYEFAQGMVDYGTGHQPPPRIFIVYDDGRPRVPFTGRIADRNGISAVEFTNSGGGLTPEDTTILHHEAGLDTTLGQHGRGTTITLAYLESQGMSTEIESNVGGRAWKVVTSLEGTETGKTKVLRVKGSWADEGETDRTVFRVLGPTSTFLDQVDKLPEYFLPANPALPDAFIVQRSADPSIIPLDYAVTDPTNGKTASVRCLAGVVPFEESDQSTLFVDGLKVQQRYAFEKSLFPWAIAGARDLSQNLKIARSSDSGSVDGRSEVAAALMQIALRHNINPEIFTTLLTEAEALVEHPYGAPLELNTSAVRFIPEELKEFSVASKSLLREVWREKHEGAYVANSARAVEKFARNGSGGTAVAVHEPMYAWLKEAGVQTVEDVGVMEGEKVRTGNAIRVEYADDANRLERLFLETGQYEGLVKVVTVGDEKGIEIRFPYSIHEEEDFSDRNKPAAQLARVAAIIAMKENLQIAIRSQKASERADLEFQISEGFGNRYTTELEVLKREAQPLPDKLSEGITVITLTGETLKRLNPPGPERLERIAEEAAVAAMRKRAELAAGMPTLQEETVVSQDQLSGEKVAMPRKEKGKREKKNKGPSTRNDGRTQRPEGLTRRRFLQIAGVTAGVVATGAVARYFLENSPSTHPGPSGSLSNEGYNSLYSNTNSNSGENQIGADYGGIGVFEQDYRNGSGIQDVAFEPGSKGQSVEGYYREFAGSKFVLDDTGRGRWISVESYQDQAVPVENPHMYTSKIDMVNVSGRERLPIREDERVLAIDNPSVTIKREKRTGDIIVDGSADRLVVYMTNAAPNTAPPLPVEYESILNIDSLDSNWQSLLVFLQGNQALTNDQKAALILEKWSTGFTYSEDTKYDRLAEGKNVKQVATQIVNESHGMCNYAATGMVGLLREAGIPARQVGGEMVGKTGKESIPHAWIEYYNGKYWVELEPLIKSKVEQTTSGTSSGTTTNSGPDTISGSAQSVSTENLLSQNGALLNQYKDVLRNQPSSGSEQPTHPQPSSSAPTSPQAQPGNKNGISIPWKDIGFGLAGSLAGYLTGRRRRKPGEQPEEKTEEENEG